MPARLHARTRRRPAAVSPGPVSGLPRLVDLLRESYEPGEVDQITHRNWLRVLDATWR